MRKDKLHIWNCKIVVDEKFQIPRGFDETPREAVIAAVEATGIEVLGCSSGWGGSLTDGEFEALKGYHEP